MSPEQTSKLKIIGGAIVVLAAGAVMLQPLMVYVAGLGRLISFIVTMLLLAYLVTFVVRKMKGQYNKAGTNSTDETNPANQSNQTDINGNEVSEV